MLNLEEIRGKIQVGGGDDERLSLPDSHRSVSVQGVGWFKRLLAFVGPGYLISVGYMDPGNWATDLAGGSKFGYALLWVILVSNLMAMLLQTLCVRLGIGTGRDLAQACREFYKKPVAIALWLLCEIAIIACDLAEVLGSAIALNLLFGLNLVWGVVLTGLDVMVLLGLMQFGFRKLEAVVITLVATIFVCFGINIYLSKPDWSLVGHGMIFPSIPNSEALVIAVGILGATVMPHNLYLHSSIVQTRAFEKTAAGKKEAMTLSTIDVVFALGCAFFVNAAILVLAAAVFHGTGQMVDELQKAHELLRPALGGAAATLFAVALLASGQSSTITGTLAGQIVMEGFLQVRIKPWLRRVITRGLALIPAILLVTAWNGKHTVEMLIISQVVLSMQLPFAIFPLVMFTSDKKRMGAFASPTWLQVIAYVICFAITALNIKLLWEMGSFGPALVGSAAVAIALFALWVKFGYKESPAMLATSE